jgi:hypothetical protein
LPIINATVTSFLVVKITYVLKYNFKIAFIIFCMTKIKKYFFDHPLKSERLRVFGKSEHTDFITGTNSTKTFSLHS